MGRIVKECAVKNCKRLIRGQGYAQLRVPTTSVLVQGEASYHSSSKGTVVFPVCEECFYELQKVGTRRRWVAVGLLPAGESDEEWLWRKP